MRAETESHFACKSDVCNVDEDSDTEYCNKKSTPASAKNRSEAAGIREVDSDKRRNKPSIKNAKMTAADWREVNL